MDKKDRIICILLQMVSIDQKMIELKREGRALEKELIELIKDEEIQKYKGIEISDHPKLFQ